MRMIEFFFSASTRLVSSFRSKRPFFTINISPLPRCDGDTEEGGRREKKGE